MIMQSVRELRRFFTSVIRNIYKSLCSPIRASSGTQGDLVGIRVIGSLASCNCRKVIQDSVDSGSRYHGFQIQFYQKYRFLNYLSTRLQVK
jgi:hypothetical protein